MTERNTDGDPYAAYVCESVDSSNTPEIDTPGDVTVIGEPGVDGAYIASTVTEADYGIDIRQ